MLFDGDSNSVLSQRELFGSFHALNRLEELNSTAIDWLVAQFAEQDEWHLKEFKATVNQPEFLMGLFAMWDTTGTGCTSLTLLFNKIRELHSLDIDEKHFAWVIRLLGDKLVDEEITKEVFRSIIHYNQPFFTDRLFDVIDTDNSGTVSLDELLDGLHVIFYGSKFQKLNYLFKIYDVDGNGEIDRDEMKMVIRASMGNNTVADVSIDKLVDIFMEDIDLDSSGSITFNEFETQLRKYPILVDNMSISIGSYLHGSKKRQLDRDCVKEPKIKSDGVSYMRNNVREIVFLVLYIAVNLALFVEVAVRYWPDHTVYMVIARACGQCLNFNSSFILVLMLKRMFRAVQVAHILPIDTFTQFHKITGSVIVVLAVFHTVMHVLNYGITEGRGNILMNLTWLDHGPVLTGITLIVLLIVIIALSLPCVRHKGYFEVFWYSHHLCIVWWMVLIFHGADFWKWFVGPLVLYITERVVCWVKARSFGQSSISSMRLYPSKVSHLRVKRPKKFHFDPGDYVYLQIPSVAKHEWHPFTISSAPEHTDYIDFHIRSVGDWTSSLYNSLKNQTEHNLPIIKTTLKVNTATETVTSFVHSAGISTKNASSAGPSTKNVSMSSSVNLDGMTPTEIENMLYPGESSRKTSLLSKDSDDRSRKESSGERSRKESQLSKDSGISVSAIGIHNVASDHSIVDSYLHNKETIIEIQECDDNTEIDRQSESTNIEIIGSHRESRDSHIEMKVNIDDDVTQLTHDVTNKNIKVTIEGPYGTPTSHIFHSEHAVLIGSGIGVTPFASILQSVCLRYRKAQTQCPGCKHEWTHDFPEDSVKKLQKVDFFWINHDNYAFEWFYELLAQLESQQQEVGGAMERFLDLHLYMTAAINQSDMRAVGLQLALDLLYSQERRDVVTGLTTRTHPGRPNWDVVFADLSSQKKGRITVFFCGNSCLGKVIKNKCHQYGFGYKPFQ